MAYRSLRTLLAAFGLSQVSGRSFRNDIPGANATGAELAHYILSDWTNWASSDLAGYHSSGDLIHFTFDFLANDYRWINLRLASPLGMGVDTDIGSDPGGRGAAIVGGSWGGSLGGNAITVQVTGRRKHGTYSGGSGVLTVIRNYFKEYNPPDGPLSNVDTDWEILVNTNVGTYSPPSTEIDTFGLVIQYPATTPAAGLGSFNDYLTHTENVSVYTVDDGPLPADIPQLEWHSNSSFTALESVDQSFTFVSGESYPFSQHWLRYRYHPTDAWTSFSGNPVIHDDPRFA